MKRLSQCVVCENLYPTGLCYQARTDKIVQELSGNLVNKKATGHICPLCNRALGFKTNTKKIIRQEMIVQEINKVLRKKPSN